MKIGIVNWTDSAVHGAHELSADDPCLKPIKAVSVGVLVKETEEAVTLAIDSWETGYYRSCETILRRQIDHFQVMEIKVTKK